MPVTKNSLEMTLDIALNRLAWSRSFAHELIDGLSEEQLVARAGGVGNHALWVMGHLANTDDQILADVNGERGLLDESFNTLFGAGSMPSNNAVDYPSRQVLLDAMSSTRRRMIAWASRLDEQRAYTPTPDALKPFAPDWVSIPFTVSSHELYHLGQIGTVRASFGIGFVHA